MARTVDHLSGGRSYLEIGAGWFERDYREYGYKFGSGPERVAARIKARLAKLSPPPAGRMPILVGGGGEQQVTLRLVATYADAWNGFGPPEMYKHKMGVHDSWCERVGRDPAEIERTVGMNTPDELDRIDEYLKAGATHLILGTAHPFDLDPVRRLLELAQAGSAGR